MFIFTSSTLTGVKYQNKKDVLCDVNILFKENIRLSYIDEIHENSETFTYLKIHLL